MKVARVVLDVPLDRAFDYIAADLTEHDIGRRALVPFGKRAAIGVIVELVEHSDLPAERLKTVVRVLHDAPGFSTEDLRLLKFASDYYHYPLGQVVLNALPTRLRHPPKREAAVEYALTDNGSSAAVDDIPKGAKTRRNLLLMLHLKPVLPFDDVQRLSRSERTALREFERLGWVERRTRASKQPPAGPTSAPQPRPPLTPAQDKAIGAICEAIGRFQTFVLYGVTGSGKTEVYLRAASTAIERGYQVMLIVPEIGLTPQLEGMVRDRFPHTPITSLHSGLNETERLRNWLSACSGEARIILGTRLAIFTPLPQLGLIAVDEEHDPSLKQTDGFCYSARDLAVVRANQRGIPVVLGSATPSMETYHNARIHRYTMLELPERINARPPVIRCVSMRGVNATDGLAPQLMSAIAQRLARREQTLVFLNRRGYSPVLMCHSCGWLSGCERCSAKLVLHLPARELHCHHCGYRVRVPHACPSCGNPALTPLGQGTQRIEETLCEHFPGARVLRVDRDSTRRKHAWSQMRNRIHAREVDILVGTQMLSKGHDFPHLALVGVLNADSMLYSSDFRASERLYALLTQVSGRAGRGESQGEVLVQTEFPDHPLYAALRDQDMARFAQSVLEERQLAGFPPFVHQALLRAEASHVQTALAFLEEARDIGRALGGVELYDPVPATMVRLAGRERAQLLVQSSSRRSLHDFLSAWRDILAAGKQTTARWMLEIDPIEL